MIFKVIVVGLLAWQLIQLLRRRREKPAETTYVVVTPEALSEKESTFLNQRGPPPSYDSPPIKY